MEQTPKQTPKQTPPYGLGGFVTFRGLFRGLLQGFVTIQVNAETHGRVREMS